MFQDEINKKHQRFYSKSKVEIEYLGKNSLPIHHLLLHNNNLIEVEVWQIWQSKLVIDSVPLFQ